MNLDRKLLFCGKLSRFVSVFFMVLIGIYPARYGWAQSQANCEAKIQHAHSIYRLGRFDETIKMLTGCLENFVLSEKQESKVYRLLGYAYLAKNIEGEAKKHIHKLLKILPDYQANPVDDTPEYTSLVENVREDIQKISPKYTIQQSLKKKSLSKSVIGKKKQLSNKWQYIGGGTLVAGVLTAVLLINNREKRDNNQKKMLPIPPIPPE